MLGGTTFSVVEVARGPRDVVKKNDQIKISQFRTGRKGDLFLLFGKQNKEMEWRTQLEITETTYQYIVQAPSLKSPTTKRLEYFVKFLESSDQLVSIDAYGEFANAPYEDIVQVKHKLDRAKIAKWVADPETVPNRLPLYCLLLGLCGNDDDAKVMEKKINEQTQDFRLGIDGLISGYLLLTGEKGLATIDQGKLRDKKAPFSETYAAMQALRFMWTYGNGRIPKERLRQSMRELLDRPELADLVVADLARWEDWSVQQRLMNLYGQGEYSIPSIKRAIVRYLLTAAKVQPPKADETKKDDSTATKSKPDELPASALQARANLEKLKELDPKTVKEAERFFFLQ
jgi:hypothetical protein